MGEFDYMKDTVTRKLIVITTGGTGGHIFPAIEVAQRLADIMHRHAFEQPTGERKYDIMLLGDKRVSGFTEALPGITKKRVHAAGISGKDKWHKFLSMMILGFGCLQVLVWFLYRRPTAVVGFGGYASLPALFIARLLRIPYMLHEQNAVLGRANRFALQHAKRLALSFENTQYAEDNVEAEIVQSIGKDDDDDDDDDEIADEDVQKIRYSGNPVRGNFAASEYEPSSGGGEFRLLITGGSQGAQFFGETIPQALALLPNKLKGRLRVIQQVRGNQINQVQDFYREQNIDAALSPFLSDMPELLDKTHLFIGRSGASTIAEILAVGRPSLLIPLPNAIDNHQHANAESLHAKKAALLVPQDKASAKELSKKIKELMEKPEALTDIAGAASNAYTGDAAEVIKNILMELVEAA